MKKKIAKISAVLIVILLNFFFWNAIKINQSSVVDLQLSMQADKNVMVQVFYSEYGEFEESQSQSAEYKATEKQELTFQIPGNTKYLRMDWGNETAEIVTDRMAFAAKGVDVNLLENYEDWKTEQSMLEIQGNAEGLHMNSTGNDPYVVLDLSQVDFNSMMRPYLERENLVRKIILCTVFDIVCVLVYLWYRKSWTSIKQMSENRSLILDLAKNDFKTKYAGSYLGIVWAFVQPIVTILVYWFVFQVGFRSGTTEGVPFVLWLTAGLVPWFFFNEALNSATASLLDYSYLVKKVVFDVEIVPLIRILSALFVHVFFVAFMIVMFLLNGIYPSLAWVQLIYYSVCLVLLVVGISYATSALVVFFRDLSQIIIVILQIGMWMTPIMWNLDIIPSKFQFIFKMNPLCYIVQGYRDALIYHKWFWDSSYQTVFFWLFILACLLVGNKVFAKLKIHFADVI